MSQLHKLIPLITAVCEIWHHIRTFALSFIGH